jgi:hypothetical protein
LNCPNCGHLQSRVLETNRVRAGLRRHRICSKCRHKFSTLEQMAVFDHTINGYVCDPEGIAALAAAPDHFAEPSKKVAVAEDEAPEPRSAEQPAAAKRPSNRRWHPAGVPVGVCEEAAPLLLDWWNESRRSKQGSNAVWSEKAWLASVERVKALPSWQQVLLCKAGVEHGWQALKTDYLKEELAKPTGEGRPMPKDPAMLAALESWPKQTA